MLVKVQVITPFGTVTNIWSELGNEYPLSQYLSINVQPLGTSSLMVYLPGSTKNALVLPPPLVSSLIEVVIFISEATV